MIWLTDCTLAPLRSRIMSILALSIILAIVAGSLYINAWFKKERCAPYCARCTYDLRATIQHDGLQCPECGLSLMRVAAIRHFRRKRKSWTRRIAICCALPAILGIGFEVWKSATGFDWIQIQSTDALIATIADPSAIPHSYPPNWPEWNELDRRLVAGKLPPADIDALTDLALPEIVLCSDEQGNSEASGSLRWFQTASNSGLITPEAIHACVTNKLRHTLWATTRRKQRDGQLITVHITVGLDLKQSQGRRPNSMETAFSISDATLNGRSLTASALHDDPNLDAPAIGFVKTRGWSGERPVTGSFAIELPEGIESGTLTLQIRSGFIYISGYNNLITFGVPSGRRDNAIATWPQTVTQQTHTIELPIEIVPDSQEIVRLDTSPEAVALRNHISADSLGVSTALLSTGTADGEPRAHCYLSMDRRQRVIPQAAFDVFWCFDDQRIHAGNLIIEDVSANYGGRDIEFDNHFTGYFIETPGNLDLPETIDIELVPNPRLAERETRYDAIYGFTLRIPNIPLAQKHGVDYAKFNPACHCD
jgi:hypothetical protein